MEPGTSRLTRISEVPLSLCRVVDAFTATQIIPD